MSEFMDTTEAAAFLSLSPKTLDKLRSKGGGPVYYKLRRRVRYKAGDLRDWAESGRQASATTFKYEQERLAQKSKPLPDAPSPEKVAAAERSEGAGLVIPEATETDAISALESYAGPRISSMGGKVR